MISDSIIFFAGGNGEQMATIVTGLSAISAARRRLFFATNLPWPHEVFIAVLALEGEACQQVSGTAEMTEVHCALSIKGMWSSGKSYPFACCESLKKKTLVSQLKVTRVCYWF